MPRSSHPKSTRHSSREVREYSDSEKDSSSKDRRLGAGGGSREERENSGRVSSGEKRKQLEPSKDNNNNNNNKDSIGSGNGEEYSSSKRRKARVDDAVSDRWNGGGEDDGGGVGGGAEGTKKSKDKNSESSSSKSRRRDESEGLLVKKSNSSSGKSEGKHKESNRAERERDKDRDKERDRKGKAEKFVDGEDPCAVKHFSEKTDFDVHNLLQSPESDNQLDRRSRRRRDGSDDRDKHQDNVDIDDKLFSPKVGVTKDGRLRNEKCKVERFKEKYHEDIDRESRYCEDKLKDERGSTGYTRSRLDDKHLRDEKEMMEIRPKRFKPQDGKYDHEQDYLDCDHDFDLKWDRENYCDRNRDYIRDCEHDRAHERDNDRCRDRECSRDRDCNLDLDRDWDWDQDHDRDDDHDQDPDRDRDQGYEKNGDYDGADAEEEISKHKDSQKERKRSSDDCDDYIYGKSKAIQARYPNMEKKYFSSDRVESDIDRGRSQSRQPQKDNNVSSNRRRTSPSTCSAEEYRHFKPDELKYRDAVTEQWPKTVFSSEVIGFSGASERASKHRSSERSIKLDDVHMGDLSLERSTSKASHMGLVDRSPSSNSLERRYMNRSARWNLDIEESSRRSNASVSARDLAPGEDISIRDLPLEKPPVDDFIPTVSTFYNRTTQSALTATGFRGGVGSPFISMLEEDSRTNSGTRYKWSSDLNLGRGQGNTWRGGPNWSSSMSNGYGPFQHGPPHASFQTMMTQFPSPPLFGVRPSMEINHSGIPYHIADADRFSGHLRPIGWQNMADGSGHTHVHGWDGNSGVYRDEMHMYGGPEWEQNKHPVKARGWETGVDNWRRQNGDAKIEVPPKSLTEDNQGQASVDALFSGQGGQKPENENGNNGVQDKTLETKPTVTYSVKEASKLPTKTLNEKITYPFKMLGDVNNVHPYRACLSKLDISAELAGSDLYCQFMTFLNAGHSTVVDEKIGMLVNLKDGARAVPKSSSKLLSPSLFSATSNAVNKRALEVYKKQKLVLPDVPSVNTGQVDGKSAFKEEEQVLVSDENKAEQLLLNCHTELSKVPVLYFDPMKAEAASAAKPEQMVSSPRQMCIHTSESCEKLAGLDRSLSHDGPLKSTQIVRGDEMISSKIVVSGSCNLDETCKVRGDGPFHSADVHDSLLFSDDSSKVAGSNESESVFLSRIHRSPESTH